MKTNTMKLLASLAVATLFSTTPISFAKSTPQVEALKQDLIRVAAPELPAKAAQIVSAARTFEKQSVTIVVVLAALDLRPTTATAVVGAIAKRNPEVAAPA